jgi:hypothetical protein
VVRLVTLPPAAGADARRHAAAAAGVGVDELPPHAPMMKAVEIAKPAIVLLYFTR